jgi:glycosyltransferase involved in cell wall biosynthesis
VKTGNSFEIREKSYSLILKKSSYVIADSLESRDNLASRYNIIQKKIFTIPMLPNFFVLDFINNFKSMENVQVPKIKYNIKRDYIFYPAQFLPHKNHIYILEAVKILKDNNILIDVIFAGRERINLEYIAEVVNKFSLQDQVKIIGAVDSEYLPYLYRDSLALVMPTYFGPTNLPPIEAMALGVPVIYSDLFFNNEQVKDLVLPINLKDPHTLCDAIKNLLSNKTLKEELISRGKNHILQLIKPQMLVIAIHLTEFHAILTTELIVIALINIFAQHQIKLILKLYPIAYQMIILHVFKIIVLYVIIQDKNSGAISIITQIVVQLKMEKIATMPYKDCI